MTNVEYAVVLGIKNAIQYEVTRYEGSLDYWTNGKGASTTNSKKSADFCKLRIAALKNALEQIDMLRPQ